MDGAPLAFRCRKGVGHFTNSAGEPTGLRFGFLRTLASYDRKVKADRTVVIWDAHGHRSPEGKSVRPEAVERGYKANRDATSDDAREVWEGIPAVRDLLRLTKYTQAWEDGYEADDVIGSLARHFSGQGVSVVVASPDRDLWQLVGPRIQCWMPGSSSRGDYVGPAEVLQAFGVPSQHLLFYRACVGDPSDNLRGLSLTDQDRAAIAAWLKKLPRAYFTVSDYLQQADHGLTRPTFEELAIHQVDLLSSNWSLMELKDPGTVQIARGEPSNGALLAEFKRLEFASLVKKVGDFTGIPELGEI